MPETVENPKSGPVRTGSAWTGSGRKFVVGLVLAILTVWGLLYLGFRTWKAGYEGRAAAGRAAAARIRPLTQARPPGAEVWEWEDTVDHAEAMLIALTGSNLLSVDQIRELTGQIDDLTRKAAEDPKKSVELLKEFWDRLAKRSGPVTEIYGRPKSLLSDPP